MKRFFGSNARVTLYLASDGKCAACGEELAPGWHADHVAPWSRGGETDVINGQALCPTCNLKKGDKGMATELRAWQKRACERYEELNQRVFLLEATPGGGKTRFSAEICRLRLDAGEVQAIVVVVPTAALRKQVADAFATHTGIQLDPKWDGACALIHKNFIGAVVTYQWLAMHPGVLRQKIGQVDTLVVLDEVHHGSDDKTWGKALSYALERAIYLLLTTGTPFRTDGTPIPFVPYGEPDNKGRRTADPHFSLGYGKALNEKPRIVRRVAFSRHDGTMSWSAEGETREATFEKDLDEKGESRRLRTALMHDGEMVGAMLHAAKRGLAEKRAKYANSAVLVQCIDQKHAERIAERIERELGAHDVVLVTTDVEDAEKKLRDFNEGRDCWLVAVRMVSEGVDIPRLRVWVDLTNVVTELGVRQSIGRIVRAEGGDPDKDALAIIPDDPRLREIAAKIEGEVVAETREQKIGGGGDPPGPSTFVPLGNTWAQEGMTYAGIHCTPAEVAYAETIWRARPEAEAGAVPREAFILGVTLGRRAQGHMPTDDVSPQNSHTDHGGERAQEIEWQEEERLRKANTRLVNALVKNTAYDWREVNLILNKAVGIDAVDDAWTKTEHLQERLDVASRWLDTRIAPSPRTTGVRHG